MPAQPLTSGNDTVAVTQNSSSSQWTKAYDGLAGTDIIDLTSHTYRASTFSSYYTLSANSAGVITMTSASGGNKTMTFANFETLKIGTSVFNLGTTSNDSITGGALDDKWLYGLDGNDTLDGGLGADAMYGGAGNDTYVVDNAGDLVVENAGDGTDLVQSSVNVAALAANVENLALTGTAASATGNGLANVITGNASANTLKGAGGDDAITGGGGTDTVVMTGAKADYTVTLVSAGVYQITDNIAGRDGTDTLTGITNVTYSDGTFALNSPPVINGTANADTLTGTAANETINGLGGADSIDGAGGTDTLVGGLGDDTYVVDTTTDTITEVAADGTDLVQSSVNVTSLAANVENLTLTGTATSGTGNELANIITGNANGNLLNGGIGIDSMAGGVGDDTYVVDRAGDRTIEAADQGIDLVNSAVSYVLGANVENLKLTGALATVGTGNALANTITGNSAANVITGGLGRDIMTGGGGADRFDFNAIGETTKIAATRDIIKDFNHLVDKIDLNTIDANTKIAGDQAFKFIGSVAFHKVAGELNFVMSDLAGTVDDKTIVRGDLNGDGIADFHIELFGLKTLTAADFLL